MSFGVAGNIGNPKPNPGEGRRVPRNLDWTAIPTHVTSWFDVALCLLNLPTICCYTGHSRYCRHFQDSIILHSTYMSVPVHLRISLASRRRAKNLSFPTFANITHKLSVSSACPFCFRLAHEQLTITCSSSTRVRNGRWREYTWGWQEREAWTRVKWNWKGSSANREI